MYDPETNTLMDVIAKLPESLARPRQRFDYRAVRNGSN